MAILSTVFGAIKSLGLTKYAGKAIVGAGKYVASKREWLLANWKLVVMVAQIVALAAVITGFMLAIKGKNALIDDLEAARISAEGKMVAMDQTLGRNAAALAQCREINAANAIAYADMAQRANEAEARARVIASQAETEVEVINDAAHELRGRDEDCRRLDDPLPDWFDDWLRE